MLDHAIEDCGKKEGAVSSYLHVQTSNELAINFYQKFGFSIAETLENYYTDNDITPPHAHIMYRKL